MPPADDGKSPAPIDRAILEFLRGRLRATEQVERATITDDGHLRLQVTIAGGYYPAAVEDAVLAVRWYANDDFEIHYREVRPDDAWECRWDRHPNPHDAREHFHPPPDASTPGEDAAWPADHRDVLALVLDEVESRIETLWPD